MIPWKFDSSSSPLYTHTSFSQFLTSLWWWQCNADNTALIHSLGIIFFMISSEKASQQKAKLWFAFCWVTETSVHRCCCWINATSSLEALVSWPMVHHWFSNSSSRRTRTHPPQTGTKPGIKISVWQPPSFTSHWACNLKNSPWTHHLHCCLTARRWWQTLTLNTPLPFLSDCLALATSSQVCNLKNLPWTHHLRCCPTAWRWRQTPAPACNAWWVGRSSTCSCDLRSPPVLACRTAECHWTGRTCARGIWPLSERPAKHFITEILILPTRCLNNIPGFIPGGIRQ